MPVIRMFVFSHWKYQALYFTSWHIVKKIYKIFCTGVACDGNSCSFCTKPIIERFTDRGLCLIHWSERRLGRSPRPIVCKCACVPACVCCSPTFTWIFSNYRYFSGYIWKLQFDLFPVMKTAGKCWQVLVIPFVTAVFKQAHNCNAHLVSRWMYRNRSPEMKQK